MNGEKLNDVVKHRFETARIPDSFYFLDKSSVLRFAYRVDGIFGKLNKLNQS